MIDVRVFESKTGRKLTVAFHHGYPASAVEDVWEEEEP